MPTTAADHAAESCERLSLQGWSVGVYAAPGAAGGWWVVGATDGRRAACGRGSTLASARKERRSRCCWR
jgi:hypothetical protein